MKSIFIDSNGWIAITNKRDQLHKSAVKLNKNLLKQDTIYVTTNFVLDETYTGLLSRVGHFAAVDFGERIRNSSLLEVVHISENIEDEAWKLFKKYKDKSFSFTDCTSFVVMQQMNLEESFTSDHHFEQMGLSILLK